MFVLTFLTALGCFLFLDILLSWKVKSQLVRLKFKVQAFVRACAFRILPAVWLSWKREVVNISRMAAKVDPGVIKRTVDTLGKVITRPPLTEKLLGRPPFKYLHDIIIQVDSI